VRAQLCDAVQHARRELCLRLKKHEITSIVWACLVKFLFPE
jgi:hypothetical protein